MNRQSPIRFFTLGLYNSDEDAFFKKLVDNRIDLFCDIRRRRGVRGSKYSYANSARLQSQLLRFDIKYVHILDLAPSREIRSMQVSADKEARVSKSERQKLSEEFESAYRSQVIDAFDFKKFFSLIEGVCATRVALFCVEENPAACHRSIIASALRQRGFEDISDI